MQKNRSCRKRMCLFLWHYYRTTLVSINQFIKLFFKLRFRNNEKEFYENVFTECGPLQKWKMANQEMYILGAFLIWGQTNDESRISPAGWKNYAWKNFETIKWIGKLIAKHIRRRTSGCLVLHRAWIANLKLDTSVNGKNVKNGWHFRKF